MPYPTPIEWADATWNTVGGCDIHSPGCINCYAMKLAASARLRDRTLYRGTTKLVKGKPVFNGMLTVLPDDHPSWHWPTSWRGAQAPVMGPGKPSLIFVNDMSDMFHVDRPLDHIDRTIAPLVYSRHIGLLLTKRADLMVAYFWKLWQDGRWLMLNHPRFGQPNFDPATALFEDCVIPRLWLGFSAERQLEMDERAPRLRAMAEEGFQIFVSMEPLLERTRVPEWFKLMPKKPWIIAGGESGPDARAPHPDWIREIADDCERLGLPFFFKQWGEWQHEGQRAISALPPRVIRAAQFHVWPDDSSSAMVGKRWSGRTLDGKEHSQFPEAA